uniref:G-protein coupled receptors family 1 profile domain-containing protein n=1 Tax=Timema bartmani TaxID=61472 RepID=A0A7R9HZN6_9NEOP|nr:unnamed protein product [Timema bartmani]
MNVSELSSHVIAHKVNNMEIFHYTSHTNNILYFRDLSSNSIKIISSNVLRSASSLEKLVTDEFRFCCLARHVTLCLPPPDEFSSCEDLMSNLVLRVCIWVLGVVATFGNILVIGWRVRFKHTNQVHSFLITNLAIGDLFMGSYLLIIAGVDACYRGVYFIHDSAWRSSDLCHLAGFISTFSSELSVFTLTGDDYIAMITLDRFLVIIFPFRVRRLEMSKTRLLMAGGWVVAGVLSGLPLINIEYFRNFYGRSGVCLALHITPEKPNGWEYSSTVILSTVPVLNLASFTIIAMGYLWMYVVARTTQQAVKKEQRSSDSAMARRMTLIVATDAACWMPIILLGVLSLWGFTVPPQVLKSLGFEYLPGGFSRSVHTERNIDYVNKHAISKNKDSGTNVSEFSNNYGTEVTRSTLANNYSRCEIDCHLGVNLYATNGTGGKLNAANELEAEPPEECARPEFDYSAAFPFMKRQVVGKAATRLKMAPVWHNPSTQANHRHGSVSLWGNHPSQALPAGQMTVAKSQPRRSADVRSSRASSSLILIMSFTLTSVGEDTWAITFRISKCMIDACEDAVGAQLDIDVRVLLYAGLSKCYPPVCVWGCIRIVYLCSVALARGVDSCICNHVTKCRYVRIVVNETDAVFSRFWDTESYEPCGFLAALDRPDTYCLLNTEQHIIGRFLDGTLDMKVHIRDLWVKLEKKTFTVHSQQWTHLAYNNTGLQGQHPWELIAGHPKMKAFISQGGLQSAEEAILMGVPLIGIPFFADQDLNVKMIVERGIGLKI